MGTNGFANVARDVDALFKGWGIEPIQVISGYARQDVSQVLAITSPSDLDHIAQQEGLTKERCIEYAALDIQGDPLNFSAARRGAPVECVAQGITIERHDPTYTLRVYAFE